MACIGLLNLILIFVFIDIETDFTVWWGPVILLDVVTHFFMFAQLGYEWKNWEAKKLAWKKDVMLQELIANPDNAELDEDKLMYKVDTMILTGDDALKQKLVSVNKDRSSSDIDNDQKPSKTMKVSANMYTICYFGFMKANKEKFKLKENDQVDIWYRAIFLFVIQMTFLVTIFNLDSFDLTFKNDLAVNLCLFFTVMLLHWNCVGDARNGIYMMKYSLCNPEEFNQPVAAFILGVMQFAAIIITESANLMKCFDQKTPTNVINKFVGFALILSVPKLLHGSMEAFEVSKSVGKLVLNKSRKAVLR